MPILNQIAQTAVKPLPQAIHPKAHAIMDYINAGVMLMSAGAFWRRNKRAAVGALVSAGAMLAVNLLTDYPGGAKKVITYRRHKDIDFGLAALTAIMPEILAFKDEHERKLFVVEGALMSAATQLTRFPRGTWRSERKHAA